MENQENQETQGTKTPEIFEELAVTELEDRLELVTRCSCRVSPSK